MTVPKSIEIGWLSTFETVGHIIRAVLFLGARYDELLDIKQGLSCLINYLTDTASLILLCVTSRFFVIKHVSAY